MKQMSPTVLIVILRLCSTLINWTRQSHISADDYQDLFNDLPVILGDNIANEIEGDNNENKEGW
jgi:hypothetical protein